MALTKEIWRLLWLSSINELTSIELQKDSWLNKSNSNPHWSFVEFMSVYFDDLFCDLPYIYYVNHGWISSSEYAIIEEWHELIDNYNPFDNDVYNHIAILNDPQWLDIVAIGGAAVLELMNQLEDDKEKLALSEKINYL